MHNHTTRPRTIKFTEIEALPGTEYQSTPLDQRRERSFQKARPISRISTVMPICWTASFVRSESGERLIPSTRKSIALAMHSFLDENGTFPPAAWSKSGKPLLSWRVAILPWLGEMALYRQFRLDEPWDSPHNIKLLAAMPDVYHCGGRKEDGKTATMVFTGEGAAFDGTKAFGASEIIDGLSNTIMVVVAALVPTTDKEASGVVEAIPT